MIRRCWFVALIFLLSAAWLSSAEYISCGGTLLYDKPQTVAWAAEQARLPGDRIRIASYNIQDFTDGVDDPVERTPARALRHAKAAAALIAKIDPDILVLEEIENAAALRLLNASFAKPYPLAFVTRFWTKGTLRDLNLAVLSRIPIAVPRELDFAMLGGYGKPPRGVLSFLVELGQNRRLLVYGVHLKSNFGDSKKNIVKRYNALQVIAEDARAIRKEQPKFTWEMLVLGDMNVDPEGAGFELDTSLRPLEGWVDLWKGRTLAERTTIPTRYGDPALQFPPAAFDRIYGSPELAKKPWMAGPAQVLQRGVDTKNVLTVGGQNDTHVSDHYPVYVDILR